MCGNSEPNKKHISHHPLLIVAVTFLLTGVIGASITHWLQTEHSKTIKYQQKIEIRRKAVSDFSKQIYERRARASLVASSIRRNSPVDELKYRKNKYDESYVEWNSNIQSNLFLIRETSNSTQYSDIEQITEKYLVQNILTPLDNCITKAYDAKINNENAVDHLNICKSSALLQRAMDCGYAITDELYKLSIDESNENNALKTMQDRCTAQYIHP